MTSSGSEVPSAMTVRAIMRSEMPMELAMLLAELTTRSEPPMMPARPSKVIAAEGRNFQRGFSTAFLSRE